MTGTEPQQRLLSSALKCLKTMQVLASSAREMTLAEICKSVGAAKATVHQQLQTLVVAGLVVKSSQTSYKLSLATLELGRAAHEQHGVGSGVAASVAALAAKSGEAATLAVREGNFVRLVYRVTIDNSILAGLGPGSLMPIHLSASGAVLQAFDPLDPDRDEGDSERLAEIRQQGYAVSVDEYLVGMSTIAIPVIMTGSRVASLSLAAPTFRFDKDRLLKLLTRSRLL